MVVENMVVESEAVSVPVLDVQYFAAEGKSPAHEIEDVVTVSSSPRRLSQVRVSDLISAELSASQLVSFLHHPFLFC
jgi:protein phosphatase 2C family protein 2/3